MRELFLRFAGDRARIVEAYAEAEAHIAITSDDTKPAIDAILKLEFFQ